MSVKFLRMVAAVSVLLETPADSGLASNESLVFGTVVVTLFLIIVISGLVEMIFVVFYLTGMISVGAVTFDTVVLVGWVVVGCDEVLVVFVAVGMVSGPNGIPSTGTFGTGIGSTVTGKVT